MYPRILYICLSQISAAINLRLLNFNATRHTVHRHPIQTPIVPHPQRDSSAIYRQERVFLRYLCKVLPSRVTLVRTDRPRDPLDFPATSPYFTASLPLQNPRLGRIRVWIPMRTLDSSIPTTTQSSATAPTTFRSRLHYLSTWWLARTYHALPPIFDVPLTPGKLSATLQRVLPHWTTI